MWNIQLQTEIYLSYKHSDWITLSQSLYKNTPIINITKESEVLGYNVGTDSLTVLCKMFEHEKGDLALYQDTAM